MPQVAEFPYFEVQFTKDRRIHDQREVDLLLDFLAQRTTTDLFIISHGWNNNVEEARELYRKFLAEMRAEIDANPLVSGRQFTVLAVLWPSKKFADKSLIAGGGAAGSDSRANTVLKNQLEELKGGFDSPDADQKLEQAKDLVEDLESDPEAQRKFADLIRSLLPKEKQPDVEGTESFFSEDGNSLMERLARRVPTGRPVGDEDEGGVAAISEAEDDEDDEGSAAGLIEFLGGVKNGALNILNYTTYYQMKERAGLIGEESLNLLLRQFRQRFPDKLRHKLRLHLIGHSFGSRLVTAAAAGGAADPTQAVADTMTLLQGAFSHYGFAHQFDGLRDGFFRQVISQGTVAGPVLITYTQNDTAVGRLYPLASMVAGQDAAGIGGPEDRFGGIGCNGAQKTPESVSGRLLAREERYDDDFFTAGRLHNLRSDDFIKDHSDICSREVAHAIIAAVAKT